jgi:hypothetical protein
MVTAKNQRGDMSPNHGMFHRSFKFFRNDRFLCMFDPETFKIYLYREGHWIESDDPVLREDIRLCSVELSWKEAIGQASA